MASSRPGSASKINRTEIDSVPVFWASAPGPLRAALTFRVGQADEDLPRHGMTHLIEHLVLSRTESAPHAYNGSTGSVLTNFVVAGTTEQVTDYLSAVCLALTDLPTDRLDHERRILRSEAAERAGGVVRSLTAMRWGPLGFGLTAYPEFALEHVTEEQLRNWSSTRFVAQAAALWLSGPPPAGLRLALPSGAPAPVPTSNPAARTPFSYTYSDRGFGASVLAERGAAGAVLGYLLQRRLNDRLRHELGLVYGVNATLDRLTGGLRHLCFLAECLQENAAPVQEQLVAVLHELRERPATNSELGDLRDSLFGSDDDPLSVLGDLDQLCSQHLLGEPLVTRADLRAEIEQLGAEDVQREAVAALDTLVIAVPDANAIRDRFAPPMPAGSEHTVTPTTTLRPRPTRTTDKALHLGSDGITIVTAGGQPVTVLYAECVAALRYPDDVRVLYGQDGFLLSIDAHHWLAGADVVQRIDRSIPQQRQIPLAEPRVPPEERRAQDKAEQRSKRAIAGWFALAVMLTVAFFPAALWPIVRSVQESRRSGIWRTHLIVGYALLGSAAVAGIVWIASSPA